MKRSKQILKIVIGVLGLGSFISAHADTLTSYQINSTLADGGTFSAVLNFDSTYVFGTTLVGYYATATLSGLVNEKVSVLQGNCVGVGCGGDETGLIFGIPQGQIDLFYPGITLYPSVVAAFNGVLCVQGVSGCDENSSDIYSYANGSDPFTHPTVNPLATTPEPSSLALLGTGLLGLVGAVRRRRP